MSIIGIQRKLREAGRIRIGEQVPTSAGKTRPARLEAFRFTSADERAIRAIAQLYGGEARKWETAPIGDQWEVLTASSSIPVVIPPSDISFSQFYEEWSGGGCLRRCDGQFDYLNQVACTCDAEARACKPHTRLSLLLSDLEGLGLWRLDTQGFYAASELAGAVELLEAMQRGGRMVAARLGLEQRQAKRIGKGGKPETRNFAVPTLDFGFRPSVLTAGDGAVAEIQAPQTPQPALMAPKPLSTAEALRAVEEKKPPVRRSNSAPELPSTGLRPSAISIPVSLGDELSEREVLVAELPEPTPPRATRTPKAQTPEQRAEALAQYARKVGTDKDLFHDLILDSVVATVTDGATTDPLELSIDQAKAALAILKKIGTGDMIAQPAYNADSEIIGYGVEEF